jgi:hypothetical protein
MSGAALGSLGRHLVGLGCPRASLAAPMSIFHGFGFHLESLHGALDHDFSRHAFGMISRNVFRRFVDVHGDPGT